MSKIEQAEYLDKLHQENMLIMDEIDRLCKKHGLRYYLVGGSLLGAIRHKGFIPWDDDLDIAMPRDDMNRFISLAPKELHSDFYLEWISTNPNYWAVFPKVCRKGTVFDEGYVVNTKPSGIFVDIFPLDYSPEYGTWMEAVKQKFKRYHYIACARTEKVSGFKTLCYKLMSLVFTNKYCYQKQEETCLALAQKGKSHFANIGSQYKLSKQTMPIEWYGQGVPINFENRSYMAPEKYIYVVESIYGKQYMLLPPENKRRCHYPTRVVFSNGEELIFKKPDHVVSIEEQDK